MTTAGQSGGLPPLEYSDCFLDSPTFRDVVVLYEKEVDSNYALVKSLVRQCDSMIQATKGAPFICYSHFSASIPQSLSLIPLTVKGVVVEIFFLTV